MKTPIVVVGVLFVLMGLNSVPAAPSAKSPVEETPHLQFVQEYTRELGELEYLRANVEKASKQKNANPFSEGIYYSTRVQSALRSNIAILSGMHLAPPYDFLTSSLIEMHKKKFALHGELVAIESQIMAGPKPDIDYGALSVRMPQVRAQLDDIDQLGLTLSAGVFATLVRDKPDKDGHMSRLIITRAERADLLQGLQASFGEKLDQDKKNYIVSAALILRNALRQQYHCADEPE